MAKTVYTPEDIVLQDGKKIILRPLVMTVLKEAMAYIDNPDEDPENPTDGIDFITNLAAICLKGQVEEDYDLGMSLDPVTAKRIILVGTGIDFDDTNLMMASAAAAAAQSGATLTS
jgi:hypothetical protein